MDAGVEVVATVGSALAVERCAVVVAVGLALAVDAAAGAGVVVEGSVEVVSAGRKVLRCEIHTSLLLRLSQTELRVRRTCSNIGMHTPHIEQCFTDRPIRRCTTHAQACDRLNIPGVAGTSGKELTMSPQKVTRS